MEEHSGPKIVVIGGGTGTFQLLHGLKKYTPNLTALVGMADDGGSTGLLRDEYGVLPPGDVRQALVALARTPHMKAAWYSKVMKCTKAIIALAGYGGRRVPITKAIEKCMIPVGNRPIVDYIVDDCIAAGIKDIIFVVGEQASQIRTYYGHNQGLEDYLVKNHKLEALESISDLKTKARFHFVLQDSKQPYGTTVPVWLARDYIQTGENFLFLYGDNIFYREDGGSAIADFLSEARASGASAALLVNEVPHDKVSHYGIVATETRGGHHFFKYIHEKPSIKEAPSNLNNSGCFLINPTIFPFVERSMQHVDPRHNEKYFIDAMNWYHDAGHAIAVVRMNADYLDCGSVEGWLRANNRIIGDKSV